MLKILSHLSGVVAKFVPLNRSYFYSNRNVSWLFSRLSGIPAYPVPAYPEYTVLDTGSLWLPSVSHTDTTSANAALRFVRVFRDFLGTFGLDDCLCTKWHSYYRLRICICEWASAYVFIGLNYCVLLFYMLLNILQNLQHSCAIFSSPALLFWKYAVVTMVSTLLPDQYQPLK